MSDETTVTLRVPLSTDLPKEETGEIVRVVGNSVAYVRLLSGPSLAFAAEDIDGYRGQAFDTLGLRVGTLVRVATDPQITSGIAVSVPCAIA